MGGGTDTKVGGKTKQGLSKANPTSIKNFRVKNHLVEEKNWKKQRRKILAKIGWHRKAQGIRTRARGGKKTHEVTRGSLTGPGVRREKKPSVKAGQGRTTKANRIKHKKVEGRK